MPDRATSKTPGGHGERPSAHLKLGRVDSPCPASTLGRLGFAAAAAIWTKLYHAKYGIDYPWRGRCNKHLADIIAEVRGDEAFDSVAAAYLADGWTGYIGHELKNLSRDLTRFRAIATKQHQPPTMGRRTFQDN